MKSVCYFLAIAAVTITAASCSHGRTLNLVSYNVGVFRKYTGDSSPMVAAMMKELDPDFISLNELDSCCYRTGGVFQLKDFATRMGEGWDFRFARTIEFQGGAYGIGVAVSPRHKILSSSRLPLPEYDGDEARALCVVETDGYVFASTHLDYRGDTVRVCQARDISAWLKEHYAKSCKPVILCGDFNDSRDSDVMKALSKDWDVITPDAPTYPSTDPHVCIDNIMILKNGVKFEVEEARVAADFEDGDVTLASDHLPVMAKVRFKP